MGDPTPYGLREKGWATVHGSTPALRVPEDLSRTTDFEEAPGIEIAVWPSPDEACGHTLGYSRTSGKVRFATTFSLYDGGFVVKKEAVDREA